MWKETSSPRVVRYLLNTFKNIFSVLYVGPDVIGHNFFRSDRSAEHFRPIKIDKTNALAFEYITSSRQRSVDDSPSSPRFFPLI